MIIAEPLAAHRQRVEARRRQVDAVLRSSPQHASAWDQPILALLSGQSGPIRLMGAVNALAKGFRPKSRRQREEVKVEIIKVLCAMVREGLVTRRRKYVQIANATMGRLEPPEA